MEGLASFPEKKQFSSPEEETAFLREMLAQKERELAEKNLKKEDTVSIEQKAREVVQDYRQSLSEEVLHPDYALSQGRFEELKLPLSPEEHDTRMAELLAIIEEHGIKNALSVAEKTGDAHLMDDFERFLVQYLQKFPLNQKEEKGLDLPGLSMTLFEVTLPEKTEDGETRPLKELLASMEQFYSGMLSVGDKEGVGYFSIELAVSNSKSDFTFYVAIPRNKKSLFEKMLLSVFHNAKVEEKTDDYNIFNEEGSTVASSARLSKDSVYPIKTYDSFDFDPLNIILNAFSNIDEVGEGASIQLVIKPQGDAPTKRVKKILEGVLQGEKISEAIAKNQEGVLAHVDTLMRGVGSLLASKDVKEKSKEAKKERAASVDETLVETLKHKSLSPSVAANIRIIASAGDEVAASRILSDIEASFNQFEDTHGNKFSFERVELKYLKRFLKDFSFRAFNPATKMYLNTTELSTVLHLPSTVIKSAPHLRTTKSGTAPAPLGLPKEGILLGVNSDRGVETKIHMTPNDRLRHVYTIGQTGTGKTTILKNMIAQDILNGDGVCMIDPHGSDIQDILSIIPPERYKDVIYFDPAHTERPMALNMLEYDQRFPEQKTFVVNEMLAIFNKLFDMKTAGGPMFEQYFRNATLLVVEDPGSGSTLVEVSRVLSNKAFREMKLSRCKNPIVVQFWREVAEKAQGEGALANIVPYITSKFDVFLSNDIMRPIISQEKSVFNFRKIMDERKILLVNLSKGRLGDLNANLIGLILVGKILMASLSRVDSLGQDLPPFYLYIDEFQNITTDSIATILSEARKYKLSLNMAHQFIAQLEENIRDAVFGNVGSMIAYRVGAEDAEFLEKQFAPVFSAKDLMSIDNYNAYVKMLANGSPVKPFNIRIEPPIEGDRGKIDALRELSYMTYGKPREEVEKAVMEKFMSMKSISPSAPLSH